MTESTIKSNTASHIKTSGTKLTQTENEKIDSLISLLDAEDWKLRKTAAENLGAMGNSVLPSLTAALESKNENIHYWGLKTLKQLKIADRDAVDILLQIFKSGKENSRLFVIEYLKELPIYASQLILKIALDDSSWMIRQQAVAIFQAHGRNSLPYLQNLIDEGSDNQKYWAMRCLGNVLGGDAVEPLTTTLASSNLRMHHLAVMALGETKSPAAVTLLVKCLSSRIWLVRKEAEEVLISFGRSQIESLRTETMKLLNLAFNSTKTDDVRFSIIHVVGSITGGDACVFLKKILAHKDENMRYFAVKTLGEMPEGLDVELLIGMLSDSNWVVRKKAAEIITRQGSSNIPRLSLELENKNEDVVFWTISILIEIGEEGLKALKDFAAKTESRSLKLTLLDRISGLPLEDTIEILLSKLSDRNWMVRQKAAEIISAWGDSAIPHILRVLPDTIMNQDRLYWLGTILEGLGTKGKSALNELLGTYQVNELPEIFSASHIESLLKQMTGQSPEKTYTLCKTLLFQAPRLRTLNIAFQMYRKTSSCKLLDLIVALMMDSVEE